MEPIKSEVSQDSFTKSKIVQPKNSTMTSYSKIEEQEIQKMLDKKAGPEFISKRTGAGSQKHNYIQGWHYFDLLNGIFGFNGWNSTVLETGIDSIENVGTAEAPKYYIATYALVRITLKDGTHRDDLGCGEASNARTKSAGLKIARKEAITDGVKRAARQFGSFVNYLGDDNFNKILATAKNIPPNRVLASDFIHMADLKQFRSQLNTKLVEQQPENVQDLQPKTVFGNPPVPQNTASVENIQNIPPSKRKEVELTSGMSSFDVPPDDMEKAKRMSNMELREHPTPSRRYAAPVLSMITSSRKKKK